MTEMPNLVLEGYPKLLQLFGKGRDNGNLTKPVYLKNSKLDEEYTFLGLLKSADNFVLKKLNSLSSKLNHFILIMF